ncbi:hypothetical protein V6N12_073986 [Hibiscus sabdariffa]|uniref:Uncharacterized protein n=1 Tax=Hibiscus sabdariffa TaxID=183260 RepID=A0ABR1ZY39_9ROSI
MNTDRKSIRNSWFLPKTVVRSIAGQEGAMLSILLSRGLEMSNAALKKRRLSTRATAWGIFSTPSYPVLFQGHPES